MASQQVMGFKTSYADFQKQGDMAKHKRGEAQGRRGSNEFAAARLEPTASAQGELPAIGNSASGAPHQRRGSKGPQSGRHQQNKRRWQRSMVPKEPFGISVGPALQTQNAPGGGRSSSGAANNTGGMAVVDTTGPLGGLSGLSMSGQGERRRSGHRAQGGSQAEAGMAAVDTGAPLGALSGLSMSGLGGQGGQRRSWPKGNALSSKHRRSVDASPFAKDQRSLDPIGGVAGQAHAEGPSGTGWAKATSAYTKNAPGTRRAPINPYAAQRRKSSIKPSSFGGNKKATSIDVGASMVSGLANSSSERPGSGAGDGDGDGDGLANIHEEHKALLHARPSRRSSHGKKAFVVGDFVKVDYVSREFKAAFRKAFGKYKDSDGNACNRCGEVSSVCTGKGGEVIVNVCFDLASGDHFEFTMKEFPAACLTLTDKPPDKGKSPAPAPDGAKKKFSAKSLWKKANTSVSKIAKANLEELQKAETQFLDGVGAMLENVKARREGERVVREQAAIADLVTEVFERLRVAEEAQAAAQAAVAEAARLQEEAMAAQEKKRRPSLTLESLKANTSWKSANKTITKQTRAVKQFMEEARRKAKRDKVEAVRLQAEADEVKRKLKRLEKCFADQEDQWEQEVSQVTEYADTMNKDISDADFFRDVWREQCGYALDQQCTQLEFKRALEFANGSQMEDNTLQFYMRALDMAIEVAQEDVPYNFRMFKTLAALTRRVANLEHILHDRLGEMDYTSGKGLEHKICQARNLFYLTDSAKETGTMDWEDLDVFCAAGCVEQDVVDDIKDTLMRKHNKTGFEFLDFLAYLPLFIDMQLGITNNPLAQMNSPKKHRRGSKPGNFNEEDATRVSGRSSKWAIHDDDDGSHNSVRERVDMKKYRRDSFIKVVTDAPRYRPHDPTKPMFSDEDGRTPEPASQPVADPA